MEVPAELRAARLAAQGLTRSELTSPEAVCERLLAVQGQDPRGFRLAVRARMQDVAAADVDRALADGSLVVDWLGRGTLHLVRAEDHAWLHPLLAPRTLTASDRRTQQLGLSSGEAERGREVIRSAVAADGPLTRGALRERLRAAGVPTEGQALVHLLCAASLRREVVRGPVVGTGREQAFALAEDWLGPAPAFDRDRALAELARRYLAGHRAAHVEDLARWSGLGLLDCRRGLAAIDAELRTRADGRLELARAEPVASAALPPPRLLGPFDPVLHGWRDRAWVTGGHGGLVTSNGIFKACALVEGRAVATWREPGGAVELEPLEPLAPDVVAALERDGDAVADYWSRRPSSAGYSRR